VSGLLGSVNRLIKIQEELDNSRPIEMPGDIREWTGYHPHFYQTTMEEEERRFNVQVLHRRFGKTYYKINKLIERAVDCPYPMGRYAYLGADLPANADEPDRSDDARRS
jgi:hypothetical protein